MWNIKNNTNESVYKTETDSQTWKMNLWLTKVRESRGGTHQEYGINRYKLFYIKQISNKDLPYSTGNYIVIIIACNNIMEYNPKKITESLCCKLKLTQYCKSTILQQ